jgi:hypothetical protein
VSVFSNFVLLGDGAGRRQLPSAAWSKAIGGQRTPQREKGASAR